MILFLTLAVALILALAGLTLEMSDSGSAPYPSSKNLSISLVRGQITYTQDSTIGYQVENATVSCPYTGMMVLFGVNWGNGYVRNPPVVFGNDSQLSINSSATVHQVLMTGSQNASMNITDSTGDGSFDEGDTIVFDLDPLSSDTVYTMGLFWRMGNNGGAVMEVSFAIHHGKLYAWYSQYLGNDWFWPFIQD